jgi:hypothetical protein
LALLLILFDHFLNLEIRVKIFNENFANRLTLDVANFLSNLVKENPSQFREILNFKIEAKLDQSGRNR